MERLSINAEIRDVQGKGSARSLRRQDMVPAVLYREGKAQSIKLARKELSRLINTISGEQVIVDLHFAGGEKKLALLKDYQVDPTSRELLHTDFFEVSLTEAIRVSVHVVTVGEPIGVKRDAGILQYALREVEIQCLPDKIPGKIEYDITKLELGQSVHVGDLKFEEGIKVLTDPGDVIVTVLAPAAEAAPAEEAAVAAAEPEVVKKGKKEEGAAEKTEKKEK
jgi:large subunit ribosomal protein L25